MIPRRGGKTYILACWLLLTHEALMVHERTPATDQSDVLKKATEVCERAHELLRQRVRLRADSDAWRTKYARFTASDAGESE